MIDINQNAALLQMTLLEGDLAPEVSESNFLSLVSKQYNTLVQGMSLDKAINPDEKIISGTDKVVGLGEVSEEDKRAFEKVEGKVIKNLRKMNFSEANWFTFTLDKIETNNLGAEVNFNSVEANKIDWQLRLELSGVGLENNQVVISSKSNADIDIKLVLWGSISSGLLSHINKGITEVFEQNNINDVIFYEPQFNKGDIQANGNLKSKSLGEFKASNEGLALKSDRVSHRVKFNHEQSIKLTSADVHMAKLISLQMILPQRIQVNGEGKLAEIWIRDYLTSPNGRKRLITDMLGDLSSFEYQADKITVNGQPLRQMKGRG